MDRTTIMLPPQLKARAQRRAHELGVSMGELIRDALETSLTAVRTDRRDDPLFRDDLVYDGPAPSDLAARHDEYLTVHRPDEADETRAVDLFEKYSDQAVSFTDCVSFVLMRRHAIESAFTFDQHFERAGFSRWP